MTTVEKTFYSLTASLRDLVSPTRVYPFSLCTGADGLIQSEEPRGTMTLAEYGRELVRDVSGAEWEIAFDEYGKVESFRRIIWLA